MIARYRFAVLSEEKLPPSRAYALYSSLQSMLDPEIAGWLHSQGETPVSQFLYFNRAQNQYIWQISLLGQDAVCAISPLLESLNVLTLNTGNLVLRKLDVSIIPASELVALAQHSDASSRTELHILTPVAFKQNGVYTVLPSEKLVLQSLVNKWTTTFPKYPLDDSDAFDMILRKLRIIDYSIRTTRYPLKNVYIPGFTGKLIIHSPLPAPMLEIWKLLLSFSEYSGIGIKTALGMGGVAVIENNPGIK